MNENCPCKRNKCERHGNCEACRDYHAKFKPKMPVACEKKKKRVLSSAKR